MRRTIVAAAVLMSASAAQAAPVVQFTDFIADDTRTAFVSYESLYPTNNAYLPSTGSQSYDENGLRTEQVAGSDGDNDLCSYGVADGARAWYACGGDNGYTRLTMADGSAFGDIGMQLANGYSDPSISYGYDLRLDGQSILTGSFIGASFPQYFGISGGGFDELRLIGVYQGASTPIQGNQYQALSIDAVELRGAAPAEVPEPAMLGLFGLGLAGLAMRRRRKA